MGSLLRPAAGPLPCSYPVAVEEGAAHVLEGLHALDELGQGGVETAGEAGEAEIGGGAAVDQLAGHGDLVRGDGGVAGGASFHGGAS